MHPECLMAFAEEPGTTRGGEDQRDKAFAVRQSSAETPAGCRDDVLPAYDSAGKGGLVSRRMARKFQSNVQTALRLARRQHATTGWWGPWLLRLSVAAGVMAFDLLGCWGFDVLGSLDPA